MNSLKLNGLAAGLELGGKVPHEDPDDDQGHPEDQALQRRVQQPPSRPGMRTKSITLDHPSAVVRPAFRREVPRGVPGTSTPALAPLEQGRDRLDVFQADFAVPAGRPHRPEQHPAEDRRRQSRPGRATSSSRPPSVSTRQRAKPLLAQLVEPLAVFPDEGRRPGDGGPGRPRQARGRAREAPDGGSGCAGCRGPRWSRPRPRSRRAMPGRRADRRRVTSSSGRITAPRRG